MSVQQLAIDQGNCFVHTGENKIKSGKLLLDLVTKCLEHKWIGMKTEKIEKLGKGFEKTIKPWALVFLNETYDDSFEKALAERAVRILQGHPEAESKQRIWFDSIRVCRINSTHQLRGVLCALHMNSTLEEEVSAVNKSGKRSSNIVNWIIEEKCSQPPCLIVVTDLIDLIVSKKMNHDYSDPHRYLHLPFTELSLLLVNLLETCEYESTIAKENWENSLGLSLNHHTSLLITDSGCLPPQKVLARLQQDQRSYTQKIYQILHYYIDRLV